MLYSRSAGGRAECADGHRLAQHGRVERRQHRLQDHSLLSGQFLKENIGTHGGACDELTLTF